MAQHLTSLCQRTFDPATQKPKYLTVQELHQRYQFLLIEIKADTPPADIPQLDQLFVQAVSKDLRKKLLTHLRPHPTTTNNENVQRFSNLVQHAIAAENDLTTITNIAARAAHRQAKPYAGRQQTPQNRGPRTFFGDANQEPINVDYSDNPNVLASSNPYRIATCDSILHFVQQGR